MFRYKKKKKKKEKEAFRSRWELLFHSTVGGARRDGRGGGTLHKKGNSHNDEGKGLVIYFFGEARVW